MDIIYKDVMKIWSEIYKPEQFKTAIPQDFFDFEFAMLPSKIYLEPQFLETCAELRNRFNPANSETLFPSLEQKIVPLDGLPLYIESTWEKIRNQKELNLPDQRIMVANLRCNELRDEALELVLPKINQVNDEALRGRLNNF